MPLVMRKGPLLSIFLVIFVDLLGFGIVIPILPYYAQAYGASAWQLGWLMTIYSLMQFFIAPVWGRVSDHWGRRPVLVMSILGTCLSMLVLGYAKDLTWLFIGRFLAGFFGANISTAYAYVADVTDEENRAKGMGIIGAAFGLGFVFGPAVGGLLSKWGYATPMFAGAGLAALNLVLALIYLKEPQMSTKERAANRSKRFSLKAIQQAFSDPRSSKAITLIFLVTLAITQLEVLFAIYLGHHFGYTAMQAGGLLAITGFIMAGMQGGLVGRLAKKHGELKLIRTGLIICTGALVLFVATLNITWIVTAMVFLAIGHGMLHPSLSSLCSLGAAKNNRGGTLGVYHSASSLARVLGPLIAGYLYDHAGKAVPFLAGAGFLVFGLMLLTIRPVSSNLRSKTASP